MHNVLEKFMVVYADLDSTTTFILTNLIPFPLTAYGEEMTYTYLTLSSVPI